MPSMRVPIMGTIEKERRSYFSVANVLTMLTIAGALAGIYAANAADNADTKRRISALEIRNDETRREIKDVAHEIKGDVKEVKGDVQLILRKLDSMQAVERERSRSDQSRRERRGEQ